MKKVIWWLLVVPLLPLAAVYYSLLVLEWVFTFLAEKCDSVSGRMLDSDLRSKYVAWRNKKFG